MRYYETIVLTGCEEYDGKLVIERQYNDGTVEYWSVMQIWTPAGPAQVPFQIEVPAVGCENFIREAAFANLEDAHQAAKPGIIADLKQKWDQAQRRQKSRIMLANAMPKGPA